MRFAKWQALGNDYMIVEQSELPWQLTPARARRLCDGHTGIGADGVALLRDPDERGFVARLRIFNPDGSEAELSGNGARQAILYLRAAGWTDSQRFSIQTLAGKLRAEVLGPTRCAIDMGRARLRSEDFPTGGEDGSGELEAAGRRFAFRHVNVGNPQCAIAAGDELEALDLAAIGAAIERHELFPNRTNVSFYRELAPGRIRARIFERGAGETRSSGTGACGAAVAYALAGGEEPVTVVLDGGELEVAVGEELNVTLSGEATPVYVGELSAELIEELSDETE